MSPDPDYDLVGDEDLSRQMMPRIAVPDHREPQLGELGGASGLVSRTVVDDADGNHRLPSLTAQAT